MTETKILLKRIIDEYDEDPDNIDDPQIIHPSTWFEGAQIATLEPGVSRPMSPMWRERFQFCGKWENDLFGYTWLDFNESYKWLVSDKSFGGLESTLKERVELFIENNCSFPPATVPRNSCAMFAFTPYELNECFMVWLEEKEEPVIFAYYDGDWSVYANLNGYLEYMSGDREKLGKPLDDRREFYDIFDLPRDLEDQ